MKNIVITGVAGFIGMHTAIRFLDAGYNIIGIDNFNRYYSPELKEKRIDQIESQAQSKKLEFKLYRADINSNIWEALKNIDIIGVIHLAAQAGVRYSLENPNAYLESNIIGFQRVLDFVTSSNIKIFIYASSSSVYGKTAQQPFNEDREYCTEPESYYAATKRINELMAYTYYKTKGLNSIGLRFFTVYGPWGRPDMAPMKFAKLALDRKPIDVYNHGNQKRDFTYISDIVEGIYLVAINMIKRPKYEILNIGRGEPISLLYFIENIENNLNLKITKNFTKAQVGDVEETFADISKIKTKYGYLPKVSIEEGTKKFINWYVNFQV